MKITVCGSSNNLDKETARKAFEIGKELAKNNVLILTGAGNGYPYEAAKGAFENNGKAIAVSPGKDKGEHISKYNFPAENITEFQFTGLGIPGRNLPLVNESDAAIIISGQIGTLNEFTLAFHQKKAVGILEGSGGITKLLKEIAEICKKVGEEDKVVYSKEPRELVKKLNNLNRD